MNLSFLQLEAAAELAKVLVPGAQPSLDRLAELCVDSLGQQPDDEQRRIWVMALRPAFQTLLEELGEEIGKQRVLDQVTSRVMQARTAGAVERLAERSGAAGRADQGI